MCGRCGPRHVDEGIGCGSGLRLGACLLAGPTSFGLPAFASLSFATLAFARVSFGALFALGSFSSLAGLASGSRSFPALLVLSPVLVLLGIELTAWTSALTAGVRLGLADEAPLLLDGKPSCIKWHEIPRVHSPAFQKLQGLAQELMELDTRAAVGDGGD